MKQKILAALFIAATSFSATSAFAGDAANGEAVFKKCSSCHMVGEGAKNKVGPILTNVVGSKVASVEDYKYGNSIAALGETGAVWTQEEIFAYLADPKDYLREKLDDKKAKSKMSFKLKDETERNDVIAYLATLTSNKVEEGGAATEEAPTEETTTTTTN